MVTPIEERVGALVDAIQETEAHLQRLGFDPKRLNGAKGFTRIEAIADAVDAVYTDDESKRRFEILARQVFERFKALITEPSVFAYAERHARAPGRDQAQALRFDLSRLDLEKLRAEFSKTRRKATALEDIRRIVENKLAKMLQQNPQRMDYYKRYQEIVTDYNREKDRTTIEETFARLVELVQSLDAEQQRAAEEGLNEGELAIFDLLRNGHLTKTDRERVEQASQQLFASLKALLAPLDRWWEKTQTKAEVQTFILDNVFLNLPNPPFSDSEREEAANRVYQYIWQQSSSGHFGLGAM